MGVSGSQTQAFDINLPEAATYVLNPKPKTLNLPEAATYVLNPKP